jgi:hypothetical protein
MPLKGLDRTAPAETPLERGELEQEPLDWARMERPLGLTPWPAGLRDI